MLVEDTEVKVGDVSLFVCCEPIVIGRNSENADMTNPQGDIWGRAYFVAASRGNDSFSFDMHCGFRDACEGDAIADLMFYASIPDFDPDKVAGVLKETYDPNYCSLMDL